MAKKDKTEERRAGRGLYQAKKSTPDIHPATGCSLVKDEVYLVEHKRAGDKWFAPVKDKPKAKAEPKAKAQEVNEK